MKVLVTGGTGFVGSHLIEQLRAAGHEVVAIVRRGSNRAFVESLGAEVVDGDLDDQTSLDAACEGCEIVYHSAARVEIVGTWEQFKRTTVDGTRRLVHSANRAGVGRFVFVSSCGVYHPRLLASGVVINESTPSPPPPRWFTYAIAKLQAEEVVRGELAPKTDWVIVRLGYLYGPRNRTMNTYLEPVMRQGIMTLVGNGENEMAMVYVEDAVRAIVLAGSCPGAAGTTLIAGNTERVTQRQYFDALADGFGLPRVTKKVSYPLAFIAGWVGEYLFKDGPKAAAVRRSAIALTGLPQRINCDYTQKLLGWKPRMKFSEGMQKAFEWYHREYASEAARG